MYRKRLTRNASILFVFILLLSLFTSALNTKANVPAAEAISVADAIEIGSDGSTVTVTGHIVGYVLSTDNVTRTDFKGDTNFAIADHPRETDHNKMLYVQVPKQYRDAFGLQTNPDILDKEVSITGNLEAYFTHHGLKNPSNMRFISEQPDEPLALITIEQARQQGIGEAKIKGIVTAKLKNTIHIQDETAAIAVRPTSLPVNLGDEIIVSGNLQDYRGLLQLDSASLDEHVGSNKLPDPIVLTGNELNQHQSKLATVKKVTILNVEDGGSWANYLVSDESDTTFIIRDEYNKLSLDVGATYDSITGIISSFDGEQQIIPRDDLDIVADASVTLPVYATPDAGTIPAGTKVELKSRTSDAEIRYTTDGSDPVSNSTIYHKPITVNKDMTIKAIAIKKGLQPSIIKTFTYHVYDPEKGIQIHDIQGEGHISPLKGDFVTDVEGIVTYKYEIKGANYFHLQAPEEEYDGNPKTSEGIVIYTGKAENVEIGDLVRVTGKVDEYHIDGYNDRSETDLSVTQINARDDRGGATTVIEHDVELPQPVNITSSDIPKDIIGDNGFDTFEPENYAIDFWESIEGMRVEVAPSKAVAPQQHGDLVVVTDEFATDTLNGGIRLTEQGPNAQLIQLKLYPNKDARDFAVKTGDLFPEPITGVVNYGFSNYKVYADLDEVREIFVAGDTTPESTTIVNDPEKLTIASYNVENFSANTSASETPKEKAENIARAFVHDMNSPDIVGVLEMQDNNGQREGPDDADASKSYERLIQEIEKANGPTYEYININPEYNEDGGAPHGNIRVGFLYNPKRVSLIEAEHGTATDATAYEQGKLTFNPGRIDPSNAVFNHTRKPLAAQFDFNGESVVVIANHLNSKLGDEPVFGQHQPPTLGSEPQRIEMASIINEFVQDILRHNPEENVVVLGDMNDFEFSNPLNVLKGNELTNMIELVPENERYSYVFQGHSQVLDHILVSNNIADATEIDILHINADFTEMHGRASDHDPILAQLDLTAEQPEKPARDESQEENQQTTNKNDRTEEKGDNHPKSNGSELPKTATIMYNLLLIGIVLSILGTMLILYRKRRMQP